MLSGNRNFEGRVSPDCRANYLASPPLVVAYALKGTVRADMVNEPIGTGSNGEPVYLKDIWPSNEEIRSLVDAHVHSEMFRRRYADVYRGDERWQKIEIKGGETYGWPSGSTYIQNPPYFTGMTMQAAAPADIDHARPLAIFGDSITTDHISPAGAIKPDSPAGRYLLERQVSRGEFNSYGSRRGNHEVMMRGTFANIRIRNRMLDNVEGGFTRYAPTGETMPIYDAAMLYKQDGRPLVVIAGKEYGTGSSRDWAAKGTILLGVRAVIAESFERIHRSNLVGMGVLPLQFREGENAATLGLTGREKYSIKGIAELKPRQEVEVTVTPDEGDEFSFMAALPDRHLQRARIFPRRAASFNMCCGGWRRRDARPDRHRDRRLGRGGADPARLSAAVSGALTGQSLVYQGMNIVGAAGFVINGWWHGAFPSATLNVLWLLIGVIASWRIIRKRGSSTSAM